MTDFFMILACWCRFRISVCVYGGGGGGVGVSNMMYNSMDIYTWRINWLTL